MSEIIITTIVLMSVFLLGAFFACLGGVYKLSWLETSGSILAFLSVWAIIIFLILQIAI